MQQKIPLIVLGVTALVCSRVMFAFFNDPEGPNLLIVVVMAAVVYLVSLAGVYVLKAWPITNIKNLLLAVLVQLIVISGLYFLLS